jgi:hypothetical protein
MPNYFICACTTAAVCSSCIRTVRNHCQSQNIASSNISTCQNMAWYQANERAPKNTAGTPVKFSEFKAASVLTACVRFKPTTYSSYGTGSNGQIAMCVEIDSVNTCPSNGTRYYAYSINNGSNFGTSTSNTCTCGSRVNGTCNVVIRDNTNCSQTIVKVKGTIGNGGSAKVCSCVQSK